MKKHTVIFILLITSILVAACWSSNSKLAEFTYKDGYLWNAKIAYEPEYVIKPINIGGKFGYCKDEFGKNEVCEIVNEDPDEWIYVKYEKKWIAGDGQLYKAVNLPECNLDVFGVTIVEIQGMSGTDNSKTYTITEQRTIDRVIDILDSSDYKPTPDNAILSESKLVFFLSQDFPGLRYEGILRVDDKGNKYITNLEDASLVYEIGDLLDK